jgi:hypothetical protein
MAVYALSDHFARFFTRLNPSSSFEQTAAREHAAIAASAAFTPALGPQEGPPPGYKGD